MIRGLDWKQTECTLALQCLRFLQVGQSPIGEGSGVRRERETKRIILKPSLTGWMAAQTKPEIIMLVLERDLFSPGE